MRKGEASRGKKMFVLDSNYSLRGLANRKCAYAPIRDPPNCYNSIQIEHFWRHRIRFLNVHKFGTRQKWTRNQHCIFTLDIPLQESFSAYARAHLVGNYHTWYHLLEGHSLRMRLHVKFRDSGPWEEALSRLLTGLKNISWLPFAAELRRKGM